MIRMASSPYLWTLQAIKRINQKDHLRTINNKTRPNSATRKPKEDLRTEINARSNPNNPDMNCDSNVSSCSSCERSEEIVYNRSVSDLCHFLTSAYERIVSFRPNHMNLPSNKQRKRLAKLLAEGFSWITTPGCKKHLSWYFVIVIPALILQSNGKKAKNLQNTKTLQSRLDLLEEGQLEEILNEALRIQSKLKKERRNQTRSNKGS